MTWRMSLTVLGRAAAVVQDPVHGGLLTPTWRAISRIR